MKGGVRNNATALPDLQGITEAFGTIRTYGFPSQRLTEQVCEVPEMVPSLEGLSNSARSMAYTRDITRDIEPWHPSPGASGKVRYWPQIPEVGGR